MPASSEITAPPLPHARIVQLVLACGAVAVVLAAMPYKAFDLDRYFVPKELVLHLCAAVTAFLCIRRSRSLRPTPVDLFLAAFLISGVISAVLAVNLWAAERGLAISFAGV